MKKIILLVAVASTFLFVSCEEDKDDPTPAPPPVTSNELRGTFIVNEGSFGMANGSISYLSSDGSYFAADIFNAVNSATLGDIVQSMSIYNSRGYIVVNNSQKVEVVDMKDFKSVGTITGFSSPRYLLAVNSSKAYVSDWSSNTVKIVDLNTLIITGSIPAGEGPEQMVLANNKVYVCNIGGFSMDSTVTVIDAVTDAVLTTLNVGLNPASILKTSDGNAVVLCMGSTGPDFIGANADDLAGNFVRVNTVTNDVDTIMSFDKAFHPLKMTTNPNTHKTYALVGSDAYTGNIAEVDTALQAFVPMNSKFFYGVGVDPSNGNIYAGRAGFSASCYMLRYNPNGTLIDSMQVGIGPNSFVFN